MCSGAESRGIISGDDPAISKVEGECHEDIIMKTAEGTSKNDGGRFIQGYLRQVHHFLTALLPTLSLSEVSNYISLSVCFCSAKCKLHSVR